MIVFNSNLNPLHFYLLIFIFFVLASCNNKQTHYENNTVQIERTELNLGSLYQYYTTNPKLQYQIDENLIIDYCASNNISPVRSPSGLYYSILEEGRGALLDESKKITAHYIGTLLDGTEFDNSYKRNKPLKFYIGEMIQGWNEGLSYLKPGSKALFLIPSHLAYGTESRGKLIKANSVLMFQIEILDE